MFVFFSESVSAVRKFSRFRLKTLKNGKLKTLTAFFSLEIPAVVELGVRLQI
jgi:hypothetical protein